MASFIKIVKNYETICRLGHKIINHKDLVRRCPPEKLSEEDSECYFSGNKDLLLSAPH